MSQVNHDDCWVPAADVPNSARRVIIWTLKPWISKRVPAVLSRHLDMEGAWYDRKHDIWFHSDGHIASDVTHWMEIPKRPSRVR